MAKCLTCEGPITEPAAHEGVRRLGCLRCDWSTSMSPNGEALMARDDVFIYPSVPGRDTYNTVMPVCEWCGKFGCRKCKGAGA